LRFYVGLSGRSRKCYDPQGDIDAENCDTPNRPFSTFIAWAGDCPPPSPINLHSDEAFDLQVFFDNTPAVATPLQLYAGDKLVHSAIADQNGRVRLGLLTDGKYRVVIPRKGTLDVVILPQKSGLNGPLISWFLFPKSKYKWVAGKKVVGNPCPILVLKDD
jgi:hypothetical protein